MKTEQEVLKKRRYGDWRLLAELLEVASPDAAKMRFRRGDEDALKAMQSIQENREKFIKEYNNRKQNA